MDQRRRKIEAGTPNAVAQAIPSRSKPNSQETAAAHNRPITTRSQTGNLFVSAMASIHGNLVS